MGRGTSLVAAVAASFGLTHALSAQAATARDSVGEPIAFFQRLEPVRFTLAVDIAELRADTADEAPTRNGTVSFRDGTGKTVSLPVKVKTHGRWRLTHCEFPPLSITFPGNQVAGSPFDGLRKARLTSFCKDHPAYEQYVLQELQLYRLYQVLTPFSHTPRALQVEYVDARTGRTRATRHAFFIDDRDAVADRLHSALLKAKGATGSDLQPWHRTLMGMFEYMIGNTDFLVSELHNVFLLGTPAGETVPVPYDFDYSGAVNSIYATPNPVLPIRSVRQRHFRGFCGDTAEFRKVFDLLNSKRAAIYALYDDQVGRLLRLDIATDTKRYLDDFYRTINTPELAQEHIFSRCLRRE
jgi:hypothetical protein